MKAEHIELYEQALHHEQGQSSKWFCEVNNLEVQLQIAKSHYKHHTEERDRLQNLVTRWKGHKNEVKSEN
ncbi:hypothetical protein COK05_24410 [Bacillus cereus]|uniref:Uncharacterized protein n=1 Tax=Bacillus cereus TaxID=1396 RepID=A0A2B2LJ34_BACCE|nr:hypothetical protein [Bacillus cereus]PFQ42795.1 hypothetical protein COK05_24410 [Bacillus cereus]